MATDCVCVCVKVCDYQYGEWKIKMESLMRKGIKRKKARKQKGSEEKYKTKSFYICYIISLTEVRARPRPRSPVGKRRSYGFEKLKAHPPESIAIFLELCSYILLISTQNL